MPSTIISGDFIDLGTITSISETAGFDDDFVEDYGHLKRRFRATGVPKSDTDFLLVFDFGSAQSVVAVVLNDVNFDTARVRLHTADLGNNWGAADVDSGDLTVSLDEQVNRYKIYVPIIGNKRWMVVHVPAAASAVGPYQARWEVGSVVALDSITTLTKNTYSRTSEQEFKELPLPSGGFERVSLGEIGWKGTLGFDVRKASDEDVLWALNNYTIADPLILYENNNDTSKVHLCVRDNSYEGDLIYHDVARGNSINFKELI